jgi:5-methylcytosine-specific restriction endonuclease McrA
MFDASGKGGNQHGGGGGDDAAATHVSRDERGWRSVDQRMRGLAARRAALDLEEARLLMVAKRMELHRYLGYGSFAEYIERVLGSAPTTGRDRVRVAEELEAMPAIAAAWEQGRIPYSVVREITRIATPETENVVLAYVDGLTVREVVDAMRGLEKGDDPNRRRHPELEPRAVRMELPPETHALFLEARRKLERDVGHPMTDADFMTAACAAVLCGGVSDHESATAPRHEIAIVVCEECKRSWHDVHGRSIEIPPSTVERALCDAVVLGRVDDRADTPPEPTRTIPAPTRRAVLARDHHRCRVPGCTMSVYVDVHHIDPFGQGGSHAMTNLITLCTLHHTLHHDGVITISGQARALVVTHADGRPYGAAPPPRLA